MSGLRLKTGEFVCDIQKTTIIQILIQGDVAGVDDTLGRVSPDVEQYERGNQ